MAKQKSGSKHFKQVTPKILSPYEAGLDAFRRGDFTRAIETWGRLSAADAPVKEALAEAHFRRFLAASPADPAGSLVDIQSACRLSARDGRFAYHLGLALHRLNRLAEAGEVYARAASLGFSSQRLAPVCAVLEMEQGQDISPQTYAYLSEVDRARLAPAAALLQGRPQELRAATGKDLSAALQKLQQEPNTLAVWQGLAEIALGQMQRVVETLAPRKKGQVLPQDAEAVRAYYHALALAAAGEEAAALTELEQAAARGSFPALLDALRLLATRQVRAWIAAGKLGEAYGLLDHLQRLLPGDTEVGRLFSQVLGARARQVVERGDWAQAVLDYTRLYDLVRADPDIGPLGTVVHNLAVAYEMVEDWENAAEKWNEIVALLPRRETQKPGKRFSPASRLAQLSPSEAKDWLRKRVILCYRKANMVERAVDVYKKAVKQDPDDLSLRMGLVDALLANERWVAARNELERIIQQDPRFVPARVHLAHLYKEDGQLEAAETELRSALEIAPGDEAVRKELGTLLFDMGQDRSHWDPGFAREKYIEALQFRPDDVSVMSEIGETSTRLGEAQIAQEWFERILEQGSVDAYGVVFTSYLNVSDLPNARKIVERFEAGGYPDRFSFLLRAGAMAFSTLPPDIPFFDSHKSKDRSSEQMWTDFGRELIVRALQLEGAARQVEGLRQVVASLIEHNQEIALEYALRLNQIAPQDVQNLVQLAILQAMNDQGKLAKATLQKAEKLAQKQNNRELIEQVRSARQQIANPMITMMGSFIQLRNMLGDEMIERMLENMPDMDDEDLPF